MEYVIVFALGMLAATLLIRWMARRAIDQFVERFADAVEEKAESNQLQVSLEFDQNIYFLYDNNDGSFVAQGNNLQELKTNLQHRFPNRSVNIVNGDEDILKRLSLEIENLNQTKTTT
jgi:hypothetical protein